MGVIFTGKDGSAEQQFNLIDTTLVQVRHPEIEGNTATWTGSRCNAYDSLVQGQMTGGYRCGCQALRNGVMKSLRLKPLHSIEKGLVKGDGRCVIRFSFAPK